MLLHESSTQMMRRLPIVALVVLALLTSGSARGVEQPSAPPVLRLETGMHTAPIRAAAIDAGGRLLATASFDKTVRLWSLPSGEPLRVLRPAIGPGQEGELFAVAVSPDGRFVVTGGWTGFEWEKANSLYVFETRTGELVRPLERRPGGLRPHLPAGRVADRSRPGPGPGRRGPGRPVLLGPRRRCGRLASRGLASDPAGPAGEIGRAHV